MARYLDDDWDNRHYYEGVLSDDHQRELDNIVNQDEYFDDPDEFVEDEDYDGFLEEDF